MRAACGVLALLLLTVRVSSRRTVDERVLEISEEGGVSEKQRAWTMQHLAAVVYITVGDSRPIMDIKDSDIENLDEEQTQAMRYLTGIILDTANDGTAAGNEVKAILNKVKLKVQNTAYGRDSDSNPANSMLCALAKVKNGEKRLYCKLTVYQLLTVVRQSDRCAATTTKEILHFVKTYYNLGKVWKNYKAVIDSPDFQSEVQRLKQEASGKTKMTGGGYCGGWNKELDTWDGICVYIACSEGLSNAGYGKAENDDFNKQCQERAPSDQREDWFCCYPGAESKNLKDAQSQIDKLRKIT